MSSAAFESERAKHKGEMPSPTTKTSAVVRSSIVEVVRGTETDEPIVIEIVELLRVIRRNRFVADVPGFLYGNLASRNDAAPPHLEEIGPSFDAVLRTLGLAVALFGSVVLTVRPIDRTMA
jgi:hypothetical protein